MTHDDLTSEQQRSLASALKRAGLTVEDLWVRYFGLGGDAGMVDVDAYVHGLGGLAPLQRDVLAHAVNERLDELVETHRASYSRPSRESRPHDDPLAALVRLLEGTELAPPERLPAVAEAAGRALGVDVTVHLADHDQRHLHPVPRARAAHDGGTGRDRAPLEIDTTLPGRAFRQVETLAAESPGRPRLWVPLVDGAERLGVLEIAVDDPDDLHDPGLRGRCRWLSMLLGHLVTLLNQYGDALDLVRQRTPRTARGELVRSLLPPLTAGVDGFVVTGEVHPRRDSGGGAFDYALSETTATLVILDAAGHGPRGGLIAATALAAHRSARHAGHDLEGQARAVDEAIGEQFGGDTCATAVLAELDLTTGRLRYLNAGHPAPLVVRAGRDVEPLTGGCRPPLGLGPHEVTLAEATLRPEDWLVLHTDGVTDAHDHTGRTSGGARLADFLRREAAANHPPPETARRLIRAVLDHRDGTARDAAVLLARWTTPGRLTP